MMKPQTKTITRAIVRAAAACWLSLSAIASISAQNPEPVKPPSLKHVAKDERLAAIQKAQVWTATDVPAMKTLLTRALMLADQDQVSTPSRERAQDLVQEARDLERKLIRRGLERRKVGLRTLIRTAEGSGQTREYSRLLNEYNELVRNLDEKTKEAR